jgi:ketosteroid isomerase-like protein
MTTGITRDLVRDYFQACLSRDPERVGRCLADDVEWSLGGPVDLLPFCGQRRGRDAVVDTIVRLVPSLIRLTNLDVEELLVDGDRAAALVRLTATHAETGRTISYRNAQFLRFQSGKLVELRALIDTFDAAEQVLGHPINTSLDVPPDIATSGNRITL